MVPKTYKTFKTIIKTTTIVKGCCFIVKIKNSVQYYGENYRYNLR